MYILGSKEPYLLFYCLFIVIISCLMAVYTFPEALDIQRYYEDAENSSKYLTTEQYFLYSFNNNFDFIYTVTLFIFAKLNLSLNIPTIFFLSLYYISLCEVIRRYEPTIVPGLIFLLIIFFVPFVWIQAISRNTAGIAFYYLGLFQFISNRKILGSIFFIVSIFTHISMLGWIVLSGVAWITTKITISRLIKNSIFVTLILLACIAPSHIIDIFSLIADSTQSRYASYAMLSMSSPLLSNDIGYGDKIPMLVSCLIASYLIMVNNKLDFFFWMLFLLTIGLIFSLFTSMMFTNRIIMLMPLFIGCNICSIWNSKSQSLRIQVYILAVISLGSNILHFWSYRNELFS